MRPSSRRDGEGEIDVNDLDRDFLFAADPSFVTTTDSVLVDDFVEPRGTERDLDDLETRPSFISPVETGSDCS